MRASIMNTSLAVLLASMAVVWGSSVSTQPDVCSRDVSREVALAVVDFNTRLYKVASQYYDNHFVISGYSLWLTLAAMAEGASEPVQQRMFHALNLPEEACLRLKYYRKVKRHEKPCAGLKMLRNRLFGIDESLTLNTTWAERVRSASLLNTVILPLINNPAAAVERLNALSKVPLDDLCVTGNSVLVDTFDYKGLWSSAFPNVTIEHNYPFYNEKGKRLGEVDLLRIKRIIKYAYLPKYSCMVVGIPVKENEPLNLIIVVPVEGAPTRTAIESFGREFLGDVIDNIRESTKPVEVAIPRFRIETYHDSLQVVLEQIGITGIFNNPAAVEYVSQPPAVLGEYVQRIEVNLDVSGEDYREEEEEECADEESVPLQDIRNKYVFNKPFMYGLINTNTRINIFAGAYSKPSS